MVLTAPNKRLKFRWLQRLLKNLMRAALVAIFPAGKSWGRAGLFRLGLMNKSIIIIRIKIEKMHRFDSGVWRRARFGEDSAASSAFLFAPITLQHGWIHLCLSWIDENTYLRRIIKPPFWFPSPSIFLPWFGIATLPNILPRLPFRQTAGIGSPTLFCLNLLNLDGNTVYSSWRSESLKRS